MALSLLGRVRHEGKTESRVVMVEAESDTQRVLKQLIAALEKQGFKISRPKRVEK